MKHTVKKIAALICAFILVCPAFSSCVAVPDFVPMKEDSVTALYWTSGTNKKDINKSEYFSRFASAYNSASVTEPFEDGDSMWSVIAICKDESGTERPFLISYLGNDRFNVSASKGEEEIKYSVENVELKEFASSELLMLKNVRAKVFVTFKVSAGVPADDGVPRAEDETLNTSEQTTEGTELDPPTVSDALLQTLALEDIPGGYKLSSGSDFRITSMYGLEEKTDDSKDPVDLYFWDVYLNGERVKDDISETYIYDGDEIEVIYGIRHPGE